MKYFVVTSTIFDGEYEYLQQTPIKSETGTKAERSVFQDNREWTENDYREHEISGIEEVSEEEYNIISKYIY
jgi:hypothetical protein